MPPPVPAASRHCSGLLDQTPADRQVLVEGRLRRFQPPLSLQHTTDPAVCHRQVLLPAGIARVLLDQTPADRQVLVEGRLRRFQPPLRLQYTADPAVGRGQIPLPAGIARVLLGQTSTNVQASVE
jgi:hypothetical protein